MISSQYVNLEYEEIGKRGEEGGKPGEEGEKVRASTMSRQTAPSRGSTLAAMGSDILGWWWGVFEFSPLILLSLQCGAAALQQLAVQVVQRLVHLGIEPTQGGGELLRG